MSRYKELEWQIQFLVLWCGLSALKTKQDEVTSHKDVYHHGEPQMLLHTNVYHLAVTVGFPTVARLCVFEPAVPTLLNIYTGNS